MKCGGLSDLREADPKILDICSNVKGHAEEQAGETYEHFSPVSYKTQVVAGTNYFVKVHVGNGNHVHLRIFESLAHAGKTLELTSLQKSKTEADEIVHF